MTINAIAINLNSANEELLFERYKAKGFFGRLEVYSDLKKAEKAMNEFEFDGVFYNPLNKLSLKSDFMFIEKINTKIPVVIISENPNLALKAYEFRNVIDYIVSPVEENRFQESVERIYDHNLHKNIGHEQKNIALNYIFVNYKKKFVRIDLNDIQYIVSKGDYITIATKNRHYTSYGTLKSIKDKLLDNRFVDIHRSYLINLDHVIDIDNNSVLIGKEVIPVSRLKKKTLYDSLLLI
jgi:DNA-binding LytR/AlgR family response regulator